jgi:hypothetical protein
MEVGARHLWTDPAKDFHMSKKAAIDDVFVEVSAQLETARLSEGCISKERVQRSRRIGDELPDIKLS